MLSKQTVINNYCSASKTVEEICISNNITSNLQSLLLTSCKNEEQFRLWEMSGIKLDICKGDQHKATQPTSVPFEPKPHPTAALGRLSAAADYLRDRTSTHSDLQCKFNHHLPRGASFPYASVNPDSDREGRRDRLMNFSLLGSAPNSFFLYEALQDSQLGVTLPIQLLIPGHSSHC